MVLQTGREPRVPLRPLRRGFRGGRGEAEGKPRQIK